ncbi:hypothetical protein ES702_06695 [subsurface metagenome]
MEYKFPVSLPRFTDEIMKAKKAAYVAKHGYYISPPRLSDIIHIRFHKEPDDKEWEDFKSGALKRNNPKRHGEVVDLLESKRARYRRMLASPAPTWLTNVGSVMTFMDDVNDFAGTLGVVCRIAARFAPKILSRFFLGPAGWLFLVADIFSMLMAFWRGPLSCIANKRQFEAMSDYNPFSKKSKARRARKLRKVLPGKGEMIELLQVTDNLFGIGLCLGPLVGFAQDIVAGTVRTVRGEKVGWHAPPPRPRSYEQNAFRVLKFAQVVGLASDEFTDDEHWMIYACLNGATQVIKPYRDIWDPFDQVDGLEHLLFEAPKPVYSTTKFILEEFGVDPEVNIGWPGLNKKYATADELWNFYQGSAAERFMSFCVRNRRNPLGSTGAQNACEFGKNMLLLTEGYETVDEEFIPQLDGWHRWFLNGCTVEGYPAAQRLPAFRYQYCWHLIGDKAVRVTCSCIRPRMPIFGPGRRGMYLDTRDCRLWFDTGFCIGDCTDHVTAVSFHPLTEDTLADIERGCSEIIIA